MLISTDGVIRGNIEPISAVIRQEINGEYSCNVEIALSDPLAEYFDIDAIVYLTDANGTVQQFRLERPERTLETLTAFGWHITQDLAHDIIVHKKYTNAEGSAVWADLLRSGISETRFSGTADSTAINSLTIVRQSVLNALIGSQDNSYLSRWGGEIERNNFTVNMKTQLGENRNYRVAYKKNLTGIHVTVDNSTVVNRIVPTYLNENDAATLLPEIYIDSARIGDTAVPHTATIHFGDIRIGKEIDGVVPYPDAATAEAEVRARVADLYASGIDIAMLTVDIEFVQLRNTIEYADYAALEIVRLGDVIGAEYEDYLWTSRIVAYEWDAILQRYNKLTIGSVRPSASDMSNSIVDAATVAANAAITQRTVELTGAIAAAQTTADGKNTVYYSSTMPTGGTYRVNDIWFDTDDDNKMFLFDGSAWEPVQFGENAIADLAITNAKIADAAINNAKISNLDAGKITTGVLAAERIQIGFGTTFAIGYDPSHKRRVFVTTPTPPYDVGDMWTDGPSGDIKRCKTSRASGSYTTADWEMASKYTDDTIANQALSTADGKNAVFYTASTPPTTNRKVGDVWFDADDNNKMYKWDGTAWTALLLGANSMGTTIIDGGKIVTNLLTANNIRTGTLDASIVTVSNINAGNITAGTLSVDRIAAGTITGTKLADGTVTDVKIASGLSASKITTGVLSAERVQIGAGTLFDAGYDPTQIEIGGRNLLQNSVIGPKSCSNGTYTTVSNVSTPFGVKSVGKYEKTDSSKPWTLTRWTNVFDSTDSGKEFTFSVYARTVNTGTTATVMIDISDIVEKIYTVNNDWQQIKVSAVYTYSSSTYTFLDVAISTLNVPVYIAFWKLEIGNRATDWTPAPEDLSIAGTTIITGANITTGKIQSTDGKSWFDLVKPEIVQTASISGKSAVIKLDTTNGLAFYDNTTYRGGLAVRGGKLTLLTDVLGTASDLYHYAQFDKHDPYASGDPDQFMSILRFYSKVPGSESASNFLDVTGRIDSTSEATVFLSAIKNIATLNITAGGAPYETPIGSSWIQLGRSSTDNTAHIWLHAINSSEQDATIRLWSETNPYIEFMVDMEEVGRFTSSGLTVTGQTRSDSYYVFDCRTMSGSTGIYYYPTPQTMPGHSVVPLFSYFDDGEEWRSGLLIKGWHGDTYSAWRISGPASITANDNFYLQSGVGTSWRTKCKIWHDRNDGSGSGLDADLLDGSHASAFAASSHTHSQYLTTTGTAADSDKVDGYHASAFLKLSGGTMTGDLNMGSNDIVGSTSDCWITARRIGLGVSANSTYTVDASSGYIRAGRYYAGSSAGVTDNIKFYDSDSGGYYTLVFTGGIVTFCGWSTS